jgi:hypothetical protein
MSRVPRCTTIFTSWGWRARLVPVLALVVVLVSCRDVKEPLSPVGSGALSVEAANVTLGTLTRVGAARMESNGVLRLSGPAAGKGAAWLPAKYDLKAGFTASFEYVIEAGQNDKDGFAFVIQAEGGDAIGGGQLGFNGLTRSVAVAFDTRTSDYRVAVQPLGEHNLTSSLGHRAHPVSGGPHQVTVVYTPAGAQSGNLAVSFGTVEVLKITNFDIAAYLGGQTEGWVGFTAHTEGGQTIHQTHDIRSFALEVPPATFPVTVTVTGSPGIVGITAVATKVRAPGATTDPEDVGRYWVGTTDEDGVFQFPALPAGHYIFSAYRFRLSDDPDVALNQLVTWPWPEGSGLSGGALLPGLPAYKPTIAILSETGVQSWEPRTPASLAKALQRPFEVGPGGTSAISLRMEIGNLVQCTFLDEQGNPVNFAGKEGKVYGVVPLAGTIAENLLPPIWIPPGFTRTRDDLETLKKGFGVGFSELQEGCQLRGVPPGRVTVETDPMQFGGGWVNFYATGEIGSDGGTTNLVAAATPLFIKEVADHTFEPIGDATGPRDFGNQIRYGWIPKPNSLAGGTHAPSDTFMVTTQFTGQGQYVLELWKGTSDSGSPAITVIALCEANGCKLHSVSPRTGITAQVSGVIDPDGKQGFVAWRVVLTNGYLDGDKVTFRIWSGASRSNPSDSMKAPLTSQKSRGSLGSWVIGSMM